MEQVGEIIGIDTNFTTRMLAEVLKINKFGEFRLKMWVKERPVRFLFHMI